MLANARQLSLLYEFLSHRVFLNYQYISDLLDVTEKTIRKDISIINNIIESNHMKIVFYKNKGFLLCAEDDQSVEELKKQFQYRYYNIYDLQENLKIRVNMILKKLLMSKDYIKLEHIAESIWFSNQTIAKEMKEVRKIIETYNLQLIGKPYYGLKIEGNEILFRFCYMDSICYYNHKVKNSTVFFDEERKTQFDDEEVKDISKIVLKYIHTDHVYISDLEIQKIITMIMIIHNRIQLGNTVEFDENQMTQMQSVECYLNITSLISDIEKYYRISLNKQERVFLKVLFIANTDFSNHKVDPSLYEPYYYKAKLMFQKIIQKLESMNLNFFYTDEKIKEDFIRFCIPIIVRCEFSIIENNTTSELVHIVKQTPLSCQLSQEINSVFIEEYGKGCGEYYESLLTIFIYRKIRNTIFDNEAKLNLAVYCVADRFIGEAIRDRIYPRLQGYINKIDVVTTFDLEEIKENHYDFMICFDESIPMNFKANIPIITVDYFFTNDDYTELYERMIIPSFQYSSPYSELKKGDIFLNYVFKSVKDVKEKIMSFYFDDRDRIWVGKQIDTYLKHHEWLICNHTLIFILFSNQKSRLITKLFKLKKSFMLGNKKIKRVFFFVIDIENDFVKLRTAEKTLRNLVTLEDTDLYVFAEDSYNFLYMYCYNENIKLV